jgi:hypothetical protein
VTSDAAAARRIILGYEARLNAAGADRTKVKLELYNELRSKGLDEDAELLMTFDVITRANSPNAAPPVEQPVPQPPALQPPRVPASRSQRTKKVWITAVVLALLILLGIRLTPYVYTLLVNHFSPVVVPSSHFVGEHGSKKNLLIFVHGVIGDMDNTWVNPETHASWPQLITDDRDLSDFDVFVYGYASPAMGDASSIEQISVRFLQQLKDFGFFDNYKEVSFVTHSMGGIVTKRALNMLNTQADSPILQKVHTVIYISVPSNGASLAALASWISNNPQFKGMSPKNALDFLQSVEGDWANLLRQRTPSLPFPRTYSAYETVSTGPVEVVPELYTSELSDGRVVGFDYNHINIVKPKDRDAEVYRWVKARLLEKRNQPTDRDSEHEKNIKREGSLLIEFDSRVTQMAARERQIDSFDTDLDKGNATLCIYHLAAGTGICDSTGTAKNRPLLGIVNELTGLGIGVDPTVALTTLGDIETQNGEILNSANRRVYPEGLLTKRLDSLRAYSREAWMHLEGGH